MAIETAADVEALVGQIPWTDEPMPDAVLADLCRTAIVYGLGRATRAVQEITRLRHQVSTLRADRREFWLEQAERDIATRAQLADLEASLVQAREIGQQRIEDLQAEVARQFEVRDRQLAAARAEADRMRPVVEAAAELADRMAAPLGARYADVETLRDVVAAHRTSGTPGVTG